MKHYAFPPEDAANNAKFKTVQRDDIINYARAKQYITEEEMLAALAIPQGGNVSSALGGVDRTIDVFAKTTVDLVMSYEVPARRLKKDAGVLENGPEVEMTIWLKDFPQSLQEFKALYALKQGIHGLFLLEERFVPDEMEEYSLQPSNSLNLSPSFLQQQLEEEKRRVEEKAKVEFNAEERLVSLTAALEVTKLVKTGELLPSGAPDQDLKHTFMI